MSRQSKKSILLKQFADPRDEYRLVMAIRNDLKMQKGKVAAQCGHAAVAAYAKALKQQPELLKHWMRYGKITTKIVFAFKLLLFVGGTKITVRIDSEEEMLRINEQAKKMGVLSSIVRDAGQTQVAPGSRTVIAIGPAPKSVLEQITGHLKLY